MSTNLEKHLSVTCGDCGEANTFRLFNPAPIALDGVVTCSNCRSPLGRWADLAGSRKATIARSERPGSEKAEGSEAPIPPPHSELH